MVDIYSKLISLPKTKEDLNQWNQIFHQLGRQLYEGHLVVIPTETVYGLAANAFNPQSVLNIFHAKQRPLYDPIICHVSCYQDSLKLFDCIDIELEIIHVLTQSFWPGPLSICAKASQLVPPIVTANTGFVAVRCPQNSIALKLIKEAGVPIAAPSANKFGHISPSTAEHVLKNLPVIHLPQKTNQEYLYIIDDGQAKIGIESTVCKVLFHPQDNCVYIELLRRGHITLDIIEACLFSSDILNKKSINWKCIISPSIQYSKHQSNLSKQEKIHQISNKNHNESPGMLLQHYSPCIPTYLLSLKKLNKSNVGITSKLLTSIEHDIFISPMNIKELKICINDTPVDLDQCILIDPIFTLISLKYLFQNYVSLLDETYLKGNISYIKREYNLTSQNEMIQVPLIKLNDTINTCMEYELFNSLHKAENNAKELLAKYILITDFYEYYDQPSIILPIYDRFYRAAAGRKAHLIEKLNLN